MSSFTTLQAVAWFGAGGVFMGLVCLALAVRHTRRAARTAPPVPADAAELHDVATELRRMSRRVRALAEGQEQPSPPQRASANA